VARKKKVAEADETLLQVRLKPASLKELFTKAAEVQGLDLSGLTRQLLHREVTRLRAEGTKL
jgi:hypothetical protein